ncbi:MAG: aromatic ring-hydroxylating dioxygenase subunit alpha [Caldilineaceae bacterium]
MIMQKNTLQAEWLPICRSEDVADGAVLGTRLLGEDIVMWRINGILHAWRDLCIHRGTKLSLGAVQNGCLICPYHGWRYDESGRCVHIPAHPAQTPPAKAQAITYHTREMYGMIWVALAEPPAEIPTFPEWHDASFRKLFCGPYPVDASGPRIIENFLDIAHFPFVHAGILGDQAHPEIADYEATYSAHGVWAQGVKVYQPDPYGTGHGDTVSYTYKTPRPLIAYLLKESAGPRFSILLLITPHDAAQSTAWMWMAMNYGHEIPAEELIAWQDGIFAQDRPILESQRPELLPLDLQAELHLRSDRLAIAYRQWLNELGLSFGAA